MICAHFPWLHSGWPQAQPEGFPVDPPGSVPLIAASLALAQCSLQK